MRSADYKLQAQRVIVREGMVYEGNESMEWIVPDEGLEPDVRISFWLPRREDIHTLNMAGLLPASGCWTPAFDLR